MSTNNSTEMNIEGVIFSNGKAEYKGTHNKDISFIFYEDGKGHAEYKDDVIADYDIYGVSELCFSDGNVTLIEDQYQTEFDTFSEAVDFVISEVEAYVNEKYKLNDKDRAEADKINFSAMDISLNEQERDVFINALQRRIDFHHEQGLPNRAEPFEYVLKHIEHFSEGSTYKPFETYSDILAATTALKEDYSHPPVAASIISRIEDISAKYEKYVLKQNALEKPKNKNKSKNDIER